MCKKIVLILCSIAFVLSGCSNNQTSNKQMIKVNCASSMKQPFEVLKEEFERENQGIEVQLNFAGSKTLKNQMLYGEIPDLFISASKQDMKELVEADLMRADTVVTFASNQLVLATRNDSVEFSQIGVANEKLAPLGLYTMEYLRKQEEFLQLESKLVIANDSQSLLQWVLNGDVDAGFLYQSDLVQYETLRVLFTIPQKEISDIQYQMAKGRKTHLEEAAVTAFYQFLQSKRAREVLVNHGFLIPSDTKG